MLTTLEEQTLVEHQRMTSDHRRVLVVLTDNGRARIEELGPRFSAFETDVTDGLGANGVQR